MLRVDQGRIDELLDLAGELLVAKNGLSYLARRAEQEGRGGLAGEIRERHAGLHRIAEAIQSSVMRIRMLPVSVAFQRFPRLVRDACRSLGKDVALELSGEDVEADKDIIDRLGDPLVHIVRNALDHGCERPDERIRAGKPAQARIALSASREGGKLVVEVVDDGRGIDPAVIRRKAVEKGVLAEADATALTDQQALDLVFAPGFSTAEKVTDLSGRGVGMDVVLRAVQALTGQVTIRSEKGRGTRVRLALPMTMAVSRVLTIRLGEETLAVPVESVVEALRVPTGKVRRALDGEVVDWRGRVLPVLGLAGLLRMATSAEARELEPVLVVRRAGEEVGLRVDGFESDVDVVMKPLSGVLASHPALLGSAILGDGRVLLVLNVQEVV
jgi:two-component system chemotaxis sensor kinase CheA